MAWSFFISVNGLYILFLYFFFVVLLLLLSILVSVAFITLAERKILALAQRRIGPDVTGFFGLLQALADGLKLIFKETVIPLRADFFTFFLAPLLTLSISFISWSFIPFGPGLVLVDAELGILVLFALSSLGVYGIIVSGWSSNSRYAFLGALRSAAQMISYEVSLGLILMPVFVCVGSLNLSQVIEAQQSIWFFVPLFPSFIFFIISALAETNRPPFDLPEAEAELVAGYNVEYSAIGFAFFFIGEYSNLILMAALTVVCFLGGWWPFIFCSHWFFPYPFWFGLKTSVIIVFFIWCRAALPRFRYDQLMQLSWKVFLPLSLAWLIFVASVLVFLNGIPIFF